MNRLSLEKATQILKSGGIVIFPTDTVYGIGCRFDDQKAVKRLYKIKGTPRNQPFPVLVSKTSQVKKLAIITQVGKKLIDKYWPGALTIILPSRHPEPFTCVILNVVKNLYLVQGKLREGSPDSSATPQNDTSKVGFRMPDSDLITSLIKKVGVPIMGTSANFHGKSVAKSFGDLDPKLIRLVDYVIKGKCQGGVESTVVDATFDPPKILRKGAVKLMSLNPVIPAKAGI